MQAAAAESSDAQATARAALGQLEKRCVGVALAGDVGRAWPVAAGSSRAVACETREW